MSFWAYILRCNDGSFYVGHTDDLERSVAQHEHGERLGHTHKRRPVELVWSERFQTRDDAKMVEHRLKGWSRAKKLALIDGDWDLMQLLARNWQTAPDDRPSTGSGLRNHSNFSNSATPRRREPVEGRSAQ
jgi:putative endonuclease